MSKIPYNDIKKNSILIEVMHNANSIYEIFKSKTDNTYYIVTFTPNSTSPTTYKREELPKWAAELVSKYEHREFNL